MSSLRAVRICSSLSLRRFSGAPGTGGGGTSGSVRAAGGKFSEREQALEDQYFKRKEREQIDKLRSHLKEAAAHHEEEIEHHADAIKSLEKQIKRHKEKISRHKDKLDFHKDEMDKHDD